MKIVSSKTSGGIEYKGLLSVSKKSSKKVIIHIHGMGGSIVYNDFYTHMHRFYPENGYSFLVGENRGSGIIKSFDKKNGVVILGNAFERFEDCVQDIQAWVDFAIDQGFEEVWLQSHSLGPSKVAYYMDKVRPSNITGLIWFSPSDIIGLVHYSEMINIHKGLLEEAKKLKKDGKGESLLSKKLWGEYLLSADTYLNFFGKGAKTAIFNYGDKSLGWKVINNINVPVLAITGTADDGIEPVIKPEKAMNLLKAELKKSPRVKTIVYERAEHSFNGFEKQVVADVLEFISER